ncbi:MAG: hypothetical protein BGP05_05680 [Rhizobiales bacterium 62-47]|nr:hypothetical protein [Hyphomicrobiales bacterium]OJY08367.1 MAG: hypothetical protein BGP05_05680 [Rhizobiales bacterium 62-47]
MRAQLFARQFAGPSIFLASYFALTVVGNIVYLLPGGDSLGRVSIVNFHIGSFEYAESLSYIALLLLPFVVTPLVVLLVRPIISRTVAQVTWRLLDFSRIEYVAISASVYGYVIYAFVRAEAWALLLRGEDAISAIESRFAVVDAVGFGPLASLKSLLIFLALYAFIRATRSREWFWIGTAFVNFLLMTCLLTLLNMKWPLLIYYVAISLAILMYFRHVLLGEVASILFILATYALVSTAVLRIPVAASSVPVSKNAERPVSARTIVVPKELAPSGAVPTDRKATAGGPQNVRSPAHAEAATHLEAQKAKPDIVAPSHFMSLEAIVFNLTEFVRKTVTAASEHATYLSLTLFNRMAQPFPYYFEIFTRDGQICGTLFDRVQRKENPCQPSLVVYQEMFHDQFAGRGTAPQAIHVYGYALNGWFGAIVEIFLASIVLGVLTCVRVGNDITATVAVMSGLTGYYFSQLPFEGAIVYDHGLLWWALLIVGHSILKKMLPPKSKLENVTSPTCTVS